MAEENKDTQDSEKSAEKIQALREMIYNAEKTLQGAKAMLLQLEGKKKVGRKKKITAFDGDEDGRIIEGTFDGQIMLGTDGKQYPVPANYASKSKLVEGDMLKLTITPDGSFIYKQIGPVERKRLIGIVNQDSDGNYFITSEGRPYRVLLASVTYFKVEPGDEVTLVVPRDIDSDWGSIENVIQSARDGGHKYATKKLTDDDILEKDTENISSVVNKSPVLDEWEPNLEELKKELNEEK
jgi:hypothetical protein